MQFKDEALAPQDAVDSFDRLRKSRVAFRFANESEAEEWEQDGRVDDARQTSFDANWIPER